MHVENQQTQRTTFRVQHILRSIVLRVREVTAMPWSQKVPTQDTPIGPSLQMHSSTRPNWLSEGSAMAAAGAGALRAAGSRSTSPWGGHLPDGTSPLRTQHESALHRIGAEFARSRSNSPQERSPATTPPTNVFAEARRAVSREAATDRLRRRHSASASGSPAVVTSPSSAGQRGPPGPHR